MQVTSKTLCQSLIQVIEAPDCTKLICWLNKNFRGGMRSPEKKIALQGKPLAQ